MKLGHCFQFKGTKLEGVDGTENLSIWWLVKCGQKAYPKSLSAAASRYYVKDFNTHGSGLCGAGLWKIKT